jgi:glycosidase
MKFCLSSGIHDKLGYLTGSKDALNVSALLLSSIYPHGGTADGYDVTDFTGINPDFGTMDDFYNMRVAMHKKGKFIN